MKLSVILPVYNSANFIVECLDSIYRQELALLDFEVITVDDGSTDNSLLLLTEYAKFHPNLIVIHQDNAGPSAARNRAIRQAKGDYLIFIDSDDYWLDGQLKQMVDIAYAHDLDILRGDYSNCDEKGNMLKKNIHYLSRTTYEYKEIDGETLFSSIYCMEFFTPLLLQKRSFILSNKILFEEGVYFEDIEYCTKIALSSPKAMYIPNHFYVYRLRKGSITHTINEKKIVDLIRIIDKMNNLCHNAPFGIIGTEVLHLNLAHLCTYLLVRLSEPLLYPDRKKLLSLLNISRIPVKGGKKEKFIATLYNLFGYKSIDLLHPIMTMKIKLMGNAKSEE